LLTEWNISSEDVSALKLLFWGEKPLPPPRKRLTTAYAETTDNVDFDSWKKFHSFFGTDFDMVLLSFLFI